MGNGEVEDDQHGRYEDENVVVLWRGAQSRISERRAGLVIVLHGDMRVQAAAALRRRRHGRVQGGRGHDGREQDIAVFEGQPRQYAHAVVCILRHGDEACVGPGAPPVHELQLEQPIGAPWRKGQKWLL